MQGPASDLPALIRRAKELDRDAFAALYRLSLTPVYRYVAARVRSSEEAEEVTQEVFVAALAGIAGLRAQDEPALFAWLFRIVRHKLADQLRARYRRPTASLEAARTARDPDPLPDDLASAAADRDTVRAALAELTDDQREVVICKYVLGYKNERTAQLMGKNVNAVNQLHHRALRSLQRILRAQEVRP